MRKTAAEDFWEFSLELYRLPGVADRLIAVQDAHGADVNFILFCCWCAQEGQLPLDEAFFARADRELGDWRREVVESLRNLRRQMKSGVGGVPLAVSEPLREEVKRLELDAERVMQSALAALAPPKSGSADSTRAREALNAYFRHIGVAVAGEVSTLVDLLVSVTFPRG